MIPSGMIRLHNEEFPNVTVKDSTVILKICQNLFFKIEDTPVIQMIYPDMFQLRILRSFLSFVEIKDLFTIKDINVILVQ